MSYYAIHPTVDRCLAVGLGVYLMEQLSRIIQCSGLTCFSSRNRLILLVDTDPKAGIGSDIPLYVVLSLCAKCNALIVNPCSSRTATMSFLKSACSATLAFSEMCPIAG